MCKHMYIFNDCGARYLCCSEIRKQHDNDGHYYCVFEECCSDNIICPLDTRFESKRCL